MRVTPRAMAPRALERAPRPQRHMSWRLSALWRSRHARGQFYQWAAVLVLLAVIGFMAVNAHKALTARHMHLGLAFLGNESGLSLAESILPFKSSDSFARALAAGLMNTIWISFVSLIFATLLGVLLGIARLSGNWLLSRMAAVYVEFFRNTPQLIQIVFWYMLFTLLPPARQALHAADWWYLSKRGLVLAWLEDAQAATLLLLALLAGLVAVGVFMTWCAGHRQRTGRGLPAGLLAALGLSAFMLLVWMLSGAPTRVSFPHLAGFNFRGGITLSPEFLALAMGLTLYFAAYIAEIVRSGIQSIGKGQIEAARALSLRGWRLYRYVILPQALRVVVPPLSAQYISLMKTSSLGVAIGYPELFNVTNSVVTASGHTLECIFVMGLIYLTMAIVISAAMNGLNRLIAWRGVRR